MNQRDCLINPLTGRALVAGKRKHRELFRAKTKGLAFAPPPFPRRAQPPARRVKSRPQGPTTVPRRRVKVGRREVTLPRVSLRRSTVPNAGNGVFVAEDVAKGDYVTEYGGRIVAAAEGTQLIRNNEDTHLLTLTRQWDAVDGRLQEDFPLDYYTRHHLLGSFVNDPYGTNKQPNVRYTAPRLPEGLGFVTPAGQAASRRIFIEALRPLKRGTELLVDYGSGYHKRHFRA